MNSILAFAGLILSLLIYFLIARRAGVRKITHPDIFFLSRSSHDESQFASAQVGYALQMATVYPFFLFAYSGQWWLAIWNTFFFALGIGLLYWLIPSFIKSGTHLVGSSRTLHAFVADLHNAPKLRIFTAWMSILAFTGLAAFEVVWGSRVLKILFNNNNSIYYLSIVILAFYLLLYMSLGGQRGAINTAQIQLVIAYIGLHATVVWVLNAVSEKIFESQAPIVAPLILVLSLPMLYLRLRALFRDRFDHKLRAVLSITTVLSLIALLTCLTRLPGIFSIKALSWAPIDRSPPDFWPSLIAFAGLPLVFQFVDMTNWQRMTSLREIVAQPLHLRVRKGLLPYLAESPLSWLLPVILGLSASFLLQGKEVSDPWDVFIQQILASSDVSGGLISILFVMAIGGVFLSTADGLLSAIGYSYTYDISKRGARLIDRYGSNAWPDKDVTFAVGLGRSAMFSFLAIIISVFILADLFTEKSGEKVLGLFLAFFSPMAAMSPAILVPVFCRRAAHGNVAWISILIGAMAGLVCGLISVFKGGSWQWHAINASLAFSWLIYGVGCFVDSKPLSQK